MNAKKLLAEIAEAEDARDWAQASKLWGRFRATWPLSARGYAGSADVELNQGNLVLTMDLLWAGMLVAPEALRLFRNRVPALFWRAEGWLWETPAGRGLIRSYLTEEVPVTDLVRLLRAIKRHRFNNQRLYRAIQGQFQAEYDDVGAVSSLLSASLNFDGVTLDRDLAVELLNTEDLRSLMTLFSPPSETNMDRLIELYRDGCPGISAEGRDNLALLTAERDISIFRTHHAKRLEAERAARGLTPAPAVQTGRPVRVAICVSGQLRGYREAVPTWANFGFDAAETRMYVSTWEHIGRKMPNALHAARFFEGDFRLAFQTAVQRYTFEAFVENYPKLLEAFSGDQTAATDEIERVFRPRALEVQDDVTDPAFEGMVNTEKMHLKIERAWDLFRQSGDDADLVLRIRPDKPVIAPETPVDWAAVQATCAAENVLYTDRPLMVRPNSIYVGDQVALGTPQDMEIYSTTYTRLQKGEVHALEQARRYRPHQSLAMTILSAGLLAKDFEQVEFGRLLDPHRIPADEIHRRIQADIAARPARASDAALLDAAARDAAAMSEEMA